MAKYSYLSELKRAQNEPFKYAAFSGGGAKGAIYSGVHEELERSGVLAGLEAVAGSSAGAMTAGLIATGISAEDFKKLSNETNFEKLLGEGFIVNKDGKPLYQLMHDTISNNVINYLKDKDIMDICNVRMESITSEITKLQNDSSPSALEELKILKEKQTKLQSIIDSNGVQFAEMNKRAQESGTIYFKDLDLLHLIDPIKFKDLVITATNRGTGELTIFDARKTPDVEIALACRASASIPIVFEPVKINGVEYVDGGYRDNLPQKYFDDQDQSPDVEDITDSNKEIEKSKKKGRTLALAFGSDSRDNEAHIAVYSAQEKISNPGMIMKFLMDVVFKFLAKVGGNFEYSKETNKTYEGLRDNALNAVILDTKDVGTLSFAEAQRKAEYLHVKGSIQTGRHFENHGIGTKPDLNLDRKEFMLKIFEESQNNGIVSTWKDKILGGKQEKSNDLLSFCKPEAWKGKSKTEVLSGFIASAATSRSDGKLTSGTASMKKIVDILNEPSTPSVIKKDFIALLKLDVKQEKGQTKAASIVAYKFKASDFDGLLNKMEQDKSKPKSKPQIKKQEPITLNSSKKRKNVVEDILSSKRPKSNTEKVLQSPKTDIGKTRG